ncbi:MAG: T9SS type A sorting domain-containing protein [Bacteroidales bacterium]
MKKLLLIGGLALGLSISSTAQKFESAVIAKSHQNIMQEAAVMPLKNINATFPKSNLQSKKRYGSEVVELVVNSTFIAEPFKEKGAKLSAKETKINKDGSVAFASDYSVAYHAFEDETGFGNFAYSYMDKSGEWNTGFRAYEYIEGEYNRAVGYNSFLHGDAESGVYTSFLTSPVTKQNFNFGDFAVGTAPLGEDITSENREYDENLINDPDNEFFNNPSNQSFQLGDNVYAVYNNMDFIPEPDGSSAKYNFRNQLVFVKGTWNKDTKSVDYTRSKIEVPEGLLGTTGVYYSKQPLFTADGQIGYIVGAQYVTTEEQNTDKYFYIWRTDDAGQTWSEEPMMKKFTGDEVCDALKVAIPNAEAYDNIIALNKSEKAAPFTTHEDLRFWVEDDYDMNIDKNGELHIFANFTLIYNAKEEGYISFGLGPRGQSLVHLYTKEGGKQWDSKLVYLSKSIAARIEHIEDENFKNTYPNGMRLGHYPSIITSEDQSKMAFVWTDTPVDWNSEEELESISNNKPSVYGAIYDVKKGEFIPQENYEENDLDIPYVDLSKGTAVDGKAFVLEAPHTYITKKDSKSGSILAELPLVFSEFEDADAKDFSYLKLRTINYFKGASLIVDKSVGMEENIVNSSIVVSQNIPNPCSDNTRIDVQLADDSDLVINVVSITGQNVLTQTQQGVSGNNEISLDVSNLKAGVYFYNLTVGNETFTKKMVVK